VSKNLPLCAGERSHEAGTRIWGRPPLRACPLSLVDFAFFSILYLPVEKIFQIPGSNFVKKMITIT
jgi:hypothetical protein